MPAGRHNLPGRRALGALPEEPQIREAEVAREGARVHRGRASGHPRHFSQTMLGGPA